MFVLCIIHLLFRVTAQAYWDYDIHVLGPVCFWSLGNCFCEPLFLSLTSKNDHPCGVTCIMYVMYLPAERIYCTINVKELAT